MKVRKVTDHFPTKENNELPTVLSRMVALDGLSFSMIVKSTDIRKGLEARKFKVPTSQTTIHKFVMDYFGKVCQRYKEHFEQLKAKNVKFSLSFDEWTSTANKRFMNVFIHGHKKYWNMGLIRIKKSLTAENCISILEERLANFNLDLSKDFVAVTTNGASTMVKVGKLITPQHQLYFAHGVQHAVIDVIYKKQDIPVFNNIESDDSDMEEEVDCFQECNDEQPYSILTGNYDLNKTLSKVRDFVRSFRKSPKNNEILQNYVKMDQGKEMNVILDCKTRWNSLLAMVEGVVLLETSLKTAMVDLKLTGVSNSEFQLLRSLVEVLKPVALAVKALCRFVYRRRYYNFYAERAAKIKVTIGT